MSHLTCRSLLVLSLSLLCCKKSVEPEELPRLPARVHCITAQAQKLQRSLTLRGVVEVAPAHHALVAAQVPGRLNALKVAEGQRVAAGDVLAEVDGRQARDAALQAKAVMTGAQAALLNATVTAERTTRLLEHGIASRQEVDDAQARLASARAAAAAAQSSLDAADRTAAFATVRAPIAGVVLRTLRAPGDLIDGTPATPIVELGDPAFLNLLVSAVPRDLVELAVGQGGEALFEALPEKHYRVSVSTISPMIDPLTGVGTVRLAFEGPTPPIGLAGEAHISGGETEALVVPSSALRGGASGGSEVLRCEAGKLLIAPVVPGTRDSVKVEIRSGLTTGQRFVQSDVLGLEDGQPFEELP